MRNILVVSVNWLGDAVFSTPVYRALKEAYPGARVSVLAVPRVREVLSLCPDVDELIVYDEEGRAKGLAGKVGVLMALRRRRFDAVFILRRSFTRTLLVWLAGIPVRVGFADDSWAWLLTQRADMNGCDEIHRTDVYLRVIKALGIRVKDPSCRLHVAREASALLDAKLAAKGVGPDERVVVLNTGGNWGLKQWPAGHFSMLAARLTTELGLKVVLSGGPEDVGRVGAIAADAGVSPVVLAGETDIKGLAALFKRAYMVVSADSGPLHLANAVGANVLALFGPTRPEITGPRGQGRIRVLDKDVGCNRAPCYYLECPDNKCMKALTVDDVLTKFRVLKG